jgi:HEAT repeat protein
MGKVVARLLILAVFALGCQKQELIQPESTIHAKGPKENKLSPELATKMDTLIKTLRDNSQTEEARTAATEELFEIANKSALEFLVEVLKDKNPHVRYSVALALGKIGDKRALKPLAEALKDATGVVSFSIVGAIIAIGTGDNEAVKLLLELQKDENDDVRQATAVALAARAVKGDKRVVGAVIELSRDNNEEIRKIAIAVLRKITDQDFGPDYAKWKAWYEKNKDK